jgi:hypothetical protein
MQNNGVMRSSELNAKVREAKNELRLRIKRKGAKMQRSQRGSKEGKDGK